MYILNNDDAIGKDLGVETDQQRCDGNATPRRATPRHATPRASVSLSSLSRRSKAGRFKLGSAAKSSRSMGAPTEVQKQLMEDEDKKEDELDNN